MQMLHIDSCLSCPFSDIDTFWAFIDFSRRASLALRFTTVVIDSSFLRSCKIEQSIIIFPLLCIYL